MEGLDDGSDSDDAFGQSQDHDSDSGEVDNAKLLEEAGAVLDDLDKETAERAKGVFQYVECWNGPRVTIYTFVFSLNPGHFAFFFFNKSHLGWPL